MDKFEVFTIYESSDSRREVEVEGAVPKIWVQTSEGKALFKIADINAYNPEVRSDWPEKVVSELANCLNLPAARYEFAQLKSVEELVPGSISFKLSDFDGEREPLETLMEHESNNYNDETDYNVSSVMDILESQNVQLPPDYVFPEGIKDGADMFVGAAMLDAYSCNIDRHSKNFDIITLEDKGIKYLSPIFDNGRSLGFYLTDEIKSERSIAEYSQSVYSSITIDGYKRNGLEVFAEAARLRPQAARIWQNELSKINTQQIQELFERIPDRIISPTSKEFAVNLLEHNQSQLLGLDLEYLLENPQKINDSSEEVDQKLQYINSSMQRTNDFIEGIEWHSEQLSTSIPNLQGKLRDLTKDNQLKGNRERNVNLGSTAESSKKSSFTRNKSPKRENDLEL